jgi:hypothetical protein
VSIFVIASSGNKFNSYIITEGSIQRRHYLTRLRTGRSGVPVPAGARDSDRLWCSPSGLRGAPGVKQPGRKAEIQNELGYASIPLNAVIMCTETAL